MAEAKVESTHGLAKIAKDDRTIVIDLSSLPDLQCALDDPHLCLSVWSVGRYGCSRDVLCHLFLLLRGLSISLRVLRISAERAREIKTDLLAMQTKEASGSCANDHRTATSASNTYKDTGGLVT